MKKKKEVTLRRYSDQIMGLSLKNESTNSRLRKTMSLYDVSTNHLRTSTILRKFARTAELGQESRSMYFSRQSCQYRVRKKITTEKTTFILVVIVVLFLITHSYRLSIRFYEALMPQSNTVDSFDFCFSLGR